MGPDHYVAAWHPDAFADADEPVCCHDLATPEHVAVADDTVACVVDFEHAIAAPAAFDYWRTVHPTTSSTPSTTPPPRLTRLTLLLDSLL
jgi:hypothetical protein